MSLQAENSRLVVELEEVQNVDDDMIALREAMLC